LDILAIGACGLLMTLNKETIWLGFAVVIPVIVYPLLKRVTYWPQVFLGLVFNWGVLMADAALHGTVSLNTLILYGACVFWTIGYDTLYAFQDYEEYQRIGVKSSAVKLGYEKGKRFIAGCYGLFFMGLLICASMRHAFVFGLCLVPLAVWVGRRLKFLPLKDVSACGAFFKFNALLGFLIWASILLATLVQ
jgi:4-hydroxybenzoate polyprenyltransferase